MQIAIFYRLLLRSAIALPTSITFNRSESIISLNKSIMEVIPTVFHSVTSIKDILNEKDYHNLEAVKELIAIYDATYSKYGNLKENGLKKNPFIVFEGLDATGKTTISRKIAEKYGGLMLSTPPKCMSKLRAFFDGHALRSPYYSLGNYVGELEVFAGLQNKPVFLDRYWYSTAAYALAQAVQNGESETLPRASDEVYKWPTDLLEPDIVIMLMTSEAVRLHRLSRRKNITNQEEQLRVSFDFRKNIVQAHQNMVAPKIQFIDGNGTIEEVLELVDKSIRHLF